MDAGEEARSRQYKGTAMSDDEASKIAAFGIYDKSYRNEKSSLNSRCFPLRKRYISSLSVFFIAIIPMSENDLATSSITLKVSTSLKE